MAKPLTKPMETQTPTTPAVEKTDGRKNRAKMAPIISPELKALAADLNIKPRACVAKCIKYCIDNAVFIDVNFAKQKAAELRAQLAALDERFGKQLAEGEGLE